MKAIILAAGEGTRLRPFTEHVPKCMVPFLGCPLLSYQLDVLRSGGIHDITIVTGYRANVIRNAHPECGFRNNGGYQDSNMVESLYCAADILRSGEDVLVAYSDIIYEEKAIRALTGCRGDHAYAVASNTAWRKLWSSRMEDPLDDAETFVTDGQGYISELGRKPRSIDQINGQYMGLFIIGRDEAMRLPAVYETIPDGAIIEGRAKRKMFMTAWLQSRIDAGQKAKAVPVDGGWLEFDTVADIEQYETWHRSGKLGEFCSIGR